MVKKRGEKKLSQVLKEEDLSNEGLESKPTAEEAFDFFTKVWDDDNNASKTPKMSPHPTPKSKTKLAKRGRENPGFERGDEDEAEDENDDADTKKLLASELLEQFGGYDFRTYTEPAVSTVTSMAVRMAHEKRTLFVPSSDRVDVERKLNPNERSRFAEEEGLYIGERDRKSVV